MTYSQEKGDPLSQQLARLKIGNSSILGSLKEESLKISSRKIAEISFQIVIALPRIHIPFDFMARNGIVGYGWPRSSDGSHRPPQYYEFKKN